MKFVYWNEREKYTEYIAVSSVSLNLFLNHNERERHKPVKIEFFRFRTRL